MKEWEPKKGCYLLITCRTLGYNAKKELVLDSLLSSKIMAMKYVILTNTSRSGIQGERGSRGGGKVLECQG